MEKLVDLICKTTMTAAAEIITTKNLKVDHDRICDAMKETVKAGYAELVKDLQEAREANMGEKMYKSILSTGCVLFATQSLQACGYLTK